MGHTKSCYSITVSLELSLYFTLILHSVTSL